MRKFCFLLLAILAIAGDWGLVTEVAGTEAYMTLLYGDEFVLGVRVLGKSIRNTGSSKEMVALVSDGVSDYAKNLLEVDGWTVKHIKLLANPNQVRPKRFWGVYTKLKIFSMTNYTKVVYLDADTIVVKNIEDLFKCGKFCANLKHSERLNSGVMVVEPSETLFEDMMRQVNSLYSYTGGDQGFLNSYYADFPNAHLFDPNKRLDALPEMQRLSTVYNADVGLYMLANKWMVNETELRVIHYTLGPLKPWDWWTAWLLKPVDVWQVVRNQLKDSLPGTGGGKDPHDQLMVKVLFVLPICLLVFFYYQSFLEISKKLSSALSRRSLYGYARRFYFQLRSGGGTAYSAVGIASSSISNTNKQFTDGMDYKLPVYLGAISIFICFLAVIVSLAIAFVLVPRQVFPWTGLLLMYELAFTSFFVFYKSYLNFIYHWGKLRTTQGVTNHSRLESSSYDSKGHQRGVSGCDLVTWFYWVGMACLAVIAPMLPCLLGITALFARLGLMVAGGIVFAAFVTFASEHLAIRAFIKGCEDQEQLRGRSICVLCL